MPQKGSRRIALRADGQLSGARAPSRYATSLGAQARRPSACLFRGSGTRNACEISESKLSKALLAEFHW